MKHFVLDLWDDLRAKRLWPVAAVLLLVAIAIPVFVMRPAQEPAAPEAKSAAQPAQATPAVVVDGTRDGSNLGVFGKKDPFRPPAAALAPSTSAATAAGASPAGASSPPPAIPGASPSSGSPVLSSGGSGASGSAPSGQGARPPAPPPVRRRSRAYTYVIDVDFGRKEAARRRRGLPRLTVLPSERNPVVVFLGVSTTGKRAVFLLNPALKQGGEGTCRPTRARCTFLHLSTDSAKNEHYVVGPDGVTYVLRLKAIRRVTVREASRASRRGPEARAGAKRGASSSMLFADEQR